MMELNSWFSYDPHLKITSFFIIFYRGLTISEKLGTKRLTKFILPRKDCMAFLDDGGGRLAMACVRSGSIIIPFLDTIKPSNFP
jgi:hypothetical protein